MPAFRRLDRRIAFVFVSLLLLVMALMLFFVTRSGDAIIRAESQRQLTAGARNITNLIERDRRRLELAATILSGDFGFREAIATQDRATVQSVLRNHGSRIGARVMMVVSLDGTVIADTQRPQVARRDFPFASLFRSAQQEGQASSVVLMQDGQLYQIVMVPIMAPARIAWVLMGFPLEDAWAEEFAQASGLDVSLLAAAGEVHASSLPAPLREALEKLHWQADARQIVALSLAGQHFHATALPFGRDGSVLLLHSLDDSEAVFRDLERLLAVIAAAGVALFIVGSLGLAWRIAVPINALARATRQIASGDYGEAVTCRSGDEIGQLAEGFENMRQGIATREHKIMRLAYEDTLTGLPNRTRLGEHLETLRTDCRSMIAVLDLDRFAAINDALGHPIGDALLQHVGERLAGLMPDNAMLARLWGDEFAIVVEGIEPAAASEFATTLLVALREPIPLDGQKLDVAGSLGIAVFPDDGRDLATLLRRAELAMYAAKRRQCGQMFAGDVGEGPPHEHLSLVGEMRRALDHREFELHYQPKFGFAAGRTSAVEALLRWRHPARGVVSPGAFIPFAEQTGFIREITPWLLGEVAAQAAAWRDAGFDLVVSANLSARDLLNPQLVELMRELLEVYELPPTSLCLEITESALMEDPAMALAHLNELAALGLKLSIDDYGAGHASLAYLKILPVHELKIDQSFIDSLSTSTKDAAIVRSTIALGHALGLSVVAEGIESRADLDWLAAAGCDVAQGYFISRPLPAAALADWLAAERNAVVRAA